MRHVVSDRVLVRFLIKVVGKVETAHFLVELPVY